jgi:tryptophan 2-monooxygenase
MPIVPNIVRREVIEQRGAPSEWLPWPYVDSLYDYLQILSPDRPLGTIPPDLQGAQVAVVGAGVAGMVAAYELLRAGLLPVVFEATDRIGGRGWSRPFTDSSGQTVAAFAEMGAMRVPVSDKVFYYYAGQFGLQTSGFPDPGAVPTQLYYQNQAYTWAPHADPPGPFKKISDDFNAFVTPFTTKIWGPWQEGNLDAVAAVWQGFIDQYKNTSFYEALVEGIPQWTTDDLNAFGALGMGSGGFGPLFEVGFLEMLRLIVQKWEYDQQLIQYGINCLTDSRSTLNELKDSFYTRSVTWPNGQTVSLQSLDAVRFNAVVTGIGYDAANKLPVVYWTDAQAPDGAGGNSQEFRAVVVATTTRSMEIDMSLTLPQENPDEGPSNVLTQPVRTALRDVHLVESSKLFIQTATKFWQSDPSLPQNIQTDELPRGIYCLDYPQLDTGVVLISYTWGDDSAKLLGLDVPARFQKFKQIIARINPAFAKYLVPVGPILNVDWEAEPYYYGAFKLQYPGQEPALQAAYYQFLSVTDPAQDNGVYLAGDSVSWSGGWTEGALHTGLNAAAAVIQHVGGTLPPNSPLSQKPDRYHY